MGTGLHVRYNNQSISIRRIKKTFTYKIGTCYHIIDKPVPYYMDGKTKY